MTLQEIKAAVNQGKNVYWKNTAYKVVKGAFNQYLIVHKQSVIGLTWLDGVTMNGNEKDFFIGE